MSRILPFEEFLIEIVAHLFPKFAGLRGNLFFNEKVHFISVVHIDIGQVPIVKSAIEHYSKVLACTEWTGLTYRMLWVLMGMKMLHIYQLFGKIICNKRFYRYIVHFFTYRLKNIKIKPINTTDIPLISLLPTNEAYTVVFYAHLWPFVVAVARFLESFLQKLEFFKDICS